MKKNFAITAALAAIFSMPALSLGAAQVWFTLEGGNGVSQVEAGPGLGLLIEKQDAATIYDFTVTMWANVTGAQPLYSVNTTLSANGPVSATAWNGIAPSGGAVTPAGGLNTPGPGNIATNFGAATFSPPGYTGANINLGSLSFSIDKTGGPTGDIEIFAAIGTGLYGQPDFTGATVDLGPNAGLNGGVAGSAGNLAVITIRQVPEPATLSLLGLGALALIRRRR